MDIKTYIQRIGQFLNKLDAERDKDTLLLAREARALIVRRIQNTGKDFAGKSLGKYSDNPLPTFWYEDILTTGQFRRVKNLVKKQGKGASYKQVRRLAGRQTSKVDLTFSGRMWSGTVAVITSRDADKTTATIKGRNKEANDKLAYNSERYGNILRLTSQELNMLAKARSDRFLAILKSVF